MGNWRTVRIVGTCGAADASTLDEWVMRYHRGLRFGDYDGGFHPLCYTGGICSLGPWAGEKIDDVGNLAERDYEPLDIVTALEKIAPLCPSLDLAVHCGGDWESPTRVKDGRVALKPPEVTSVTAGTEYGGDAGIDEADQDGADSDNPLTLTDLNAIYRAVFTPSPLLETEIDGDPDEFPVY